MGDGDGAVGDGAVVGGDGGGRRRRGGRRAEMAWRAAPRAGGVGRRGGARKEGRRAGRAAAQGGAARRPASRAGRRSRSVYWKWEASISRGLSLQFGGPCKMGVQIESSLELSFNPKLLKNGMGPVWGLGLEML